jgi:DNA repair exonuclease SbcCD ATPase subunit
MIEFQKLVISRFMSFGEKQVVPLANQGLVRLEGDNRDEPNATSNMAGKSTIIEALLWCLFGKTARGLKHDQVVNRFAKKDCYVSVTFTDGKSSSYVVRRYRRHSEHKNHLHLWKGDKLLSFRHDDETQKKLESILGCDFQSFVNSVIFGGADLAQIKPFARLTDSEQKKLLESFLHFEQFDMALRRTKDLLTELREKRTGNQLAIEQCKGKVASIREKIKTLRKSAKIFRKEYEHEYEEVRSKLKKLHKPKEISGKSVRKAEARTDELTEKAAKAEEAVLSVQKSRDALRKLIHGREKLMGKNCPMCGQLVQNNNLKSFLKHMSKDRRKLKKELRRAEHVSMEFRKEVAYEREGLKRLRQKLEKGRLYNSQHLQRRRELEKRLESLSRKRDSASSPFAEQVQRQLFKYGKQASNLLVLEQKDFALAKRIKDLEFWEVGFGNQGVKALIVKHSLPALNRKLKEYGKTLFRGGVELEFRPTRTTKQGTERELFHLHYKSRHGASSYLGESSGGRRRTDVCILLVFSWLSRICNILLVDEILDGLDDAGRKPVLEILYHLRKTVIVISHEKGVKEQLSKVWTVTKHHGISTVET